MDISDLGQYDSASLVDKLWEAKEAERTAKVVKGAIHAELARRVEPGDDGGLLEGRSRSVRAMRLFMPDVDDVDGVRAACRTIGIESKVFTMNKNALSSAMKESAVAETLEGLVKMRPYWQFRAQRAT